MSYHQKVRLSSLEDEREVNLKALAPLLSENEDEKASSTNLKTYPRRYLTVILFILSGTSNAIFLLTWGPIFESAKIYFTGLSDVATAVNLLTISFQIMFLPGTLLVTRMVKQGGLRSALLCGGFLTVLGGLVRWSVALANTEGDGVKSPGTYIIILLGTMIVALAQPVYNVLPALVASTWFPVEERDFATTLCALANPLGSAIGSILPSFFISASTSVGAQLNTGISTLLMVQLLIAVPVFFITFLFFKNEPELPPSQAAYQLRLAKQKSISEGSGGEIGEPGYDGAGKNSTWKNISILFSNPEYVKLFISLSIALGYLNAVAALLRQLPGGNSDEEIGLTGAALILSGFIGAFVTGLVLGRFKAYRTILKTAYFSATLSWIFFMTNCRENNFPLFIFSAALLGFTVLPVIPATIVNTVETTYPVPEDLAMGVLYVAANTLAIPLTFLGQMLLLMDPNSTYYVFFPYAIFSIGTLLVGCCAIVLFKGQYHRLEQDMPINKVESY